MSVALPFEAGQALQVAMAGAEDIEAFDVTVFQVKDGVVILAGGEDAAHLRPGAAVMVRHPGDEKSVCWGRLERACQEEDGFHLHVHGLRCERMDQRRAPRKEANLAAVVSHVVIESDGSKETRKSLGRIINASRTGVRVRSRAPLACGTLVHMQIDFGTNQPTVAIGQVVRVVPGSEYEGGGFEVGVSFARILQGAEQLYEFLSDVESSQPSVDDAGGVDVVVETASESGQPSEGELPVESDEAA